jgi:hypothetical protein
MGNENQPVVGRNSTLFHELTTTVDTNRMLLETATFAAGDRSAYQGPLEAPVSQIAAAVLQATPTEYPDDRHGVAAYPAIRFDLALSAGQPVAAFLKEQLGEPGAQTLINDWAELGVSIDGNAPLQNQAILVLDSNNKARARQTDRHANTTQEEDLKGAGLRVADDIQATIICAALVRKAIDAGLDRSSTGTWGRSKLSEQELDLLTKLRDGAVRTSSGALVVNGRGCLRAAFYSPYDYPSSWVVGAAPLRNKNT